MHLPSIQVKPLRHGGMQALVVESDSCAKATRAMDTTSKPQQTGLNDLIIIFFPFQQEKHITFDSLLSKSMPLTI